MRKILFSVCAVLAILGCGGDGDDFPCLSCGRCPNPVVSNGWVTCGGQTYRTVRIGSQTWFAENLNYNASGSVCYSNNSSNCTTYGRLYNWSTAMAVCPSGWHLPSKAEWDALGDDARKLKATTGWDSGGNGTDDYGFSALPGGYGSSDGSFGSVGYDGAWWSANENGNDSNYAYGRGMYYNYGNAYWDNYSKSNLFSVRCVQD